MLNNFLKLLFLLLIVLTLYIFSNTYFFFFILLITVLFVAFAIVMLFVVKRSLIFELNKDQGTVKNTEIPVTINIHNKSIFSITKLIIDVTMENELTDETEKRQFHLAMNPLQEEDFLIHFKSTHSGKVSIHISSITLYDIFGFFKVNKPIDKKTNVFVFPISYQIVAPRKTEGVYEHDSLLEETIQRLGTSNEYLNIKPYVTGDNVKQIHWKLSSKFDEIIIKETSEINSETIFILFESIVRDLKAKPSAVQIDTMFELFISFIKTFLLEKKQVTIAWLSDDSGELQIETLEHEQQLEYLMPILLKIKFTIDERNVLQRYKNSLSYSEREFYYLISEAQLESNENISEAENINIIKVLTNVKGEARTDFEYAISRQDFQHHFSDLIL